MIFPLFMFIAGAAIPYALMGKLEKGLPKSALHLKVVKRAVLLLIFGMIMNGLLNFNFSELRVVSVLGDDRTCIFDCRDDCFAHQKIFLRV